MKIHSISGTSGYSAVAVREKKDGGGLGAQGGHSDHHSDSSSGSDTADQEPEEFPGPDEIHLAVEGFKADAQALQNGLCANLEGRGPGLRVILTDKSGNVIRRLSGDEFVKLRDASLPEAPTCGKILDRKL